MKLRLPCPKCGRPVVFNKLKPVYLPQSKLLVTKPKLDHYDYVCPYRDCGAKAEYEKDYVREAWIAENPGKGAIPLIR